MKCPFPWSKGAIYKFKKTKNYSESKNLKTTIKYPVLQKLKIKKRYKNTKVKSSVEKSMSRKNSFQLSFKNVQLSSIP